ncbi:hypothetical protein [Pedobacter sp. MC2016-24]|uniref:hypothetical protein n=1 Tax=Pedobacter sp. MC2016-24 TaxID=2780090 RepID=UPI00188050E2|nr:hypothetical protein [Pedobacter sp. MC2016-24]MBE9602648.1 hypothetical protein [Pedobacter sp. MC2016-24]
MKKQLHFATTFGRSNPFKNLLLTIFTMSASMPRAILEVFSRSGFGRRYFSFGWCIIYALILALVPMAKESIPFLKAEGRTGWGFMFHYLSWYAFLLAFLYKSYGHYQALKLPPSIFDFSKYSYSTGILDKRFITLKWNGKYLDLRFIETIVEPAFFLVIGLGLMILGQALGILLFTCSIFYSANRFLDYEQGDEMVLDMIDKIIVAEEYSNVFVNDLGADKTRGFSIPARRLASQELRQKVADMMFSDYQEDEPVFVS